MLLASIRPDSEKAKHSIVAPPDERGQMRLRSETMAYRCRVVRQRREQKARRLARLIIISRWPPPVRSSRQRKMVSPRKNKFKWKEKLRKAPNLRQVENLADEWLKRPSFINDESHAVCTSINVRSTSLKQEKAKAASPPSNTTN